MPTIHRYRRGELSNNDDNKWEQKQHKDTLIGFHAPVIATQIFFTIKALTDSKK